ncbi:DUF3090 domain-containing protein [Cellulomonas carbonis]|uniref:Repeat protein (TIGR03847 family) n=1 Tax=Cellulomonas carbonis T26 TaxID=947969 RepID=A0A0A0BXR3_9CELL|nr:DUF3090 domain-containing protein [Cellulomonas carbonis]KGM12720.1 hypothetical protein N868_00090 [Cellulomonas carbonis T26]GGC13797.1 hypothetical protein GCM10010972_28940 [Cellulomonas carbonis]
MPLVHEFDWPDRVVVGTVGRPGERTFYLQVRAGQRSTSIALEKEQSAALAEKVDELLGELVSDARTGISVPSETPAELVDDDPLDQPVEEQFRTGTMRLGWDPRTSQVVIEAFPLQLPDDDDEVLDVADVDDADEPSEMLVVRIPVGTARAFVERTRKVVAAGRPRCPLCGGPVDADGHVCATPDV